MASVNSTCAEMNRVLFVYAETRTKINMSDEKHKKCVALQKKIYM